MYFLSVTLCLGATALALSPIYRQELKGQMGYLWRRKRALWAPLLALGLGAGPMLYTYFFGLSEYISPTRGFTKTGDLLVVGLSGYQPNVHTPLYTYSNLILESFGLAGVKLYHIHEGFFIGFFTLAFLPLVFQAGLRGRVLWVSMVVMLLYSMGPLTPLWQWSVQFLPGFKMLRHAFAFSRLTTFLVLLCALEGLQVALDPQINLRKKAWVWLAAVPAFVLVFNYCQF